MKIRLLILSFVLICLALAQEKEVAIKEYRSNGRLDALIDVDDDQRAYLVQLDIKTDSLVERVLSILPDLELYGGASSYHRLMSEDHYLKLRNSLSKENYKILDQDYKTPESRDYWALTLQGNQYYSTSGETNSSCMCLDASDCVVVGYNDSWYNPLDYYGEVSWSFSPPDYDEILEARIYVAGAQCDDLPLWSETTLSVKDNDCSWSDFQATLSLDYTINGPYIIPDDMLGDVWCSGTFQPVIGSEDNYNVNWVQVELYYICEPESAPSNFEATQEEFCDHVSLSWSSNNSIDGYSLYRDGGLIANLSSTDSQYLDYFAQNNTDHEYCLTAINTCGESESSCVIGSRRSTPLASENISVSTEFVDHISILWEETVNTQYYYLYRDGSMLSIIPEGQDLSYEDVFVEHDQIYEYCIESVNDCGSSSWICNQGYLAAGLIGDINMDSQIDILDIVILLNFILELDTPNDEQFWLSDINSDQILNILDIVLLVSVILDD